MSIKVEFQWTPQEIRKTRGILLKLQSQSIMGRLWYRLRQFPFLKEAILLPIFLFLYWGLTSYPVGNRDWLVDSTVCALLLVMFVGRPCWQYYKTKKAQRKATTVVYEFQDDVILGIEEFVRHELAWDSFSEILLTDQFLFLLSKKSKKIESIDIPRRAISDEETLLSFIKLRLNRTTQAESVLNDQCGVMVPENADFKRLMTIQIHLEYSDIKEFKYQHPVIRPESRVLAKNMRLPPWLIIVLQLTLLLVLGGINLMNWRNSRAIRGDLTYPILGLAALLVLLCIPITTWLAKRRLAKHKQTIIELYDTHLVVHHKMGKETFLWHYFLKFAETKNLYVLYFKNTHALIIPKRFFVNEQDSTLFRNTAQSGITRTKGFPILNVQTKTPA